MVDVGGTNKQYAKRWEMWSYALNVSVLSFHFVSYQVFWLEELEPQSMLCVPFAQRAPVTRYNGVSYT